MEGAERMLIAFLFIILLVPATASAVPVAHKIDVERIVGYDPDGLVTRDLTVTRVEDVAPGDVDDDGCADAEDGYDGPGCEAPPPVEVGSAGESSASGTPVAADPAPDPSGTLAPDPSGTSTPYVDPSCESGGSGGYTADTGNGYYGAYQFDQQTWDAYAPDSYGGTNPAAAPSEVQDAAAAAVPYDAWPSC